MVAKEATVTKRVVLVAALAAALGTASGIMVANHSVTGGGDGVHAGPDDLDSIREQSLLDGAIYDGHLLRYDRIPAFAAHFESAEEAKRAYDWFNQLLEDSKGNPSLEASNGNTMRIFNFLVLVGDMVQQHEVAALAIGVQMAEQTYRQPDIRPLRIYHEWLIDEYHIDPETASVRLGMLVGDMRPLANEVLRLTETGMLLNQVPTDLRQKDRMYWDAVSDYGHCTIVDKGSDCDQYLKASEERAWERPDPPGFHHADPPE